MTEGEGGSDGSNGNVGSADQLTLAKIQAAVDTKPGPLAIAGIMLAVVALPTGIISVWVPREIDNLRQSVDEAVAAATDAASHAKSAAETSMAVSDRIDSLVVSIASVEASTSHPNKMATLASSLPVDVMKQLSENGIVTEFRYTHFDNAHFVFIPVATFNLLPSTLQASVEQSFKRYHVRFFVEN